MLWYARAEGHATAHHRHSRLHGLGVSGVMFAFVNEHYLFVLRFAIVCVQLSLPAYEHETTHASIAAVKLVENKIAEMPSSTSAKRILKFSEKYPVREFMG